VKFGHVVSVLATAATVTSGCGAPTSAQSSQPPASAASTAALSCADTDQSRVDLDVPGPGQPSPEEAVAPYAGALKLAVRKIDGGTIVVGLRRDDSVFRVFRVTERADGWWPDGYSECRV
jgi:hypothetical protein